MPFKDIWLKSFKSLVFSKKFCNVLWKPLKFHVFSMPK
jgi:hypothetical protein